MGKNGQAVLSLLCYACLLISFIISADNADRPFSSEMPEASAKCEMVFYSHTDETHYLHLASY